MLSYVKLKVRCTLGIFGYMKKITSVHEKRGGGFAMNMKKKNIVVIGMILVLVILLFPVRMKLKDGGSVKYKSLVYEVTKIHQLALVEDETKPYIDGFEVKILGITVYRDVEEVETESFADNTSSNLESADADKVSSNLDSTDADATSNKSDSIEAENAAEIIVYNGKEYKKSELSNATLNWLELSEKDRVLSSYFPPELMDFEETWGITLTVEEITPTSARIKCSQSNGEPTGELHTGSWYILEKWTQEYGWTEMPYVTDENIGWEDVAWVIPMEDTVEWEVNWEWLYGTLPAGKYRIGKSITDFRTTGDYDTKTYYGEFECR